MSDKTYHWSDLLNIMNTLRGEKGCPWDIEQTHKTLKKYLLEETYEVMDAIEQDNSDNLAEELGDILLQVVFHSQIAKEDGRFTIEDVIHKVSKKMIDRHEHVFGNANCQTAKDVEMRWEKIKKKEKGTISHQDVLSSIPKNLPALIRAYKVQQKASNIGFDWSNMNEIFHKILEEVEELKISLKNQKINEISEELGDCLFSLVNLSRFLEIHPEFSLNSTTEKFIKRFSFMENESLKHGKDLENLSLEEMNILWQRAKTEVGEKHED